MLYFEKGDVNLELSSEELKQGLFSALEKIPVAKKVLAVPPDFTRFHSMAGDLTRFAYQYYGEKLSDILPALGTHFPMSDEEITKMYGDIPRSLFKDHKWRTDVVTLGEVPACYVLKVSEGKVDYPWPAQVNKMLVNPEYDLILSIGQVVPHEVTGMANYNKNVFVGTGGAEGINKSHFLGAAYGMEKMMGRADTPVRSVLDYASEHFGSHMPIIYVLTVVSLGEDGKLKVRGLYIGDDKECFYKAAELSLKVNFELLDEPLKKVVVYLDPGEYKSTWLGNKSIYRTRMAIDDGGELIVLAPGLKEFGEDKEIDRLIRKYGYVNTPRILELTKKNDDLGANLSAAAHLIHGSTENRFSVTYCPGYLSEEEIKSVNFNYAPLDQMLKKYDPKKLNEGYNQVNGEKVFFISNPALGLWAHKDRFDV